MKYGPPNIARQPGTQIQSMLKLGLFPVRACVVNPTNSTHSSIPTTSMIGRFIAIFPLLNFTAFGFKRPAVDATSYDRLLGGPWNGRRTSSNRRRFARSSAGRARTFPHRSRNDWLCRLKDIEDCYACCPPVGLEWIRVVLAICSPSHGSEIRRTGAAVSIVRG